MSEWKRELTELEERALCGFVLDSNNDIEKMAKKEYPTYQKEGLSQTLYRYPGTEECVLIIRQKGYIVNTLLIQPDEIEDFLEKWDAGELFPYGNRKHLIKANESQDKNVTEGNKEKHNISEWKRELTELEERALCSFVLDSNNNIEKMAQKDYPTYQKGEGLSHTLYKYPGTKECVLIIRQKGYIVNTLLIQPDEIEDFLEKWDAGELFPYGNREHLTKEAKAKSTPLQQKEEKLSSLEIEAKTITEAETLVDKQNTKKGEQK